MSLTFSATRPNAAGYYWFKDTADGRTPHQIFLVYVRNPVTPWLVDVTRVQQIGANSYLSIQIVPMDHMAGHGEWAGPVVAP